MAGILPSYIGGGGGLLGLPYDPFEALRMGQLPQTTMGIMPGAPVADPWPSAAIPQGAQPTQAQPQAGQPMPTGSQTAPQLGFLDKIGNGIAGNSNFLLGLGAGLLSGDYGQAGKLAMAGGQIDTQNTNRMATAQALQQSGIPANLAPVVAANPALLAAALKKKVGGATYGLNPVYVTGADGKTALLQTSDTGDAKLTNVPEGVSISTGIDKIDLGTQWALQDKKSGAIVGYLPKDVKGEEAAKAEGKAVGGAKATLDADLTTANETVGKIDQLVNDPAIGGVTGPLNQYKPTWLMNQQERGAMARIEQLKGTSFLQAYQTLKGGGQITEVEGKKAEDAIARMQRYQSGPEFRQALIDFREAVVSGMNKLRSKAGQQPAASAPSQAPASLPPPPAGFRIVQ